MNDLTKIIKSKFSDIGRGWFNMNETSKITYDFGKLKKFLTVVRLTMQDTILSLVKKSFYSLKDYILSFIPDKISVNGTHEIINEWNSDKIIKYDKWG